VGGPLRDCNDRNVCTLDRCDESRGMCLHQPRDFDNDGEADARCVGGSDCDDADPLRGTLQAELCADALDNDCDGDIDEAACGRPQHDLCDDALDVSAGGLFAIATAGARDDYGAACAGPGRELVARLVLWTRRPTSRCAPLRRAPRRSTCAPAVGEGAWGSRVTPTHPARCAAAA
jgi:hypothetical protein